MPWTEDQDESPGDPRIAMPEPCGYNLGTQAKVAICGKVCDPGKTMCPRHELVFAEEVKAQRRKEDARLDKIAQRLRPGK